MQGMPGIEQGMMSGMEQGIPQMNMGQGIPQMNMGQGIPQMNMGQGMPPMNMGQGMPPMMGGAKNKNKYRLVKEQNGKKFFF